MNRVVGRVTACAPLPLSSKQRARSGPPHHHRSVHGRHVWTWRGDGGGYGSRRNFKITMKYKLTFLCATTVGVLLPAATQAQMNNFITRDAGWYWGADVGASVAQDGHLTQFSNLSVSDPVEYGVGMGMDLSAGYAFNRYFALEFQSGWTWNPINSIEGAAVHDTSLSTVPFMANAVLRYPIPRTRIVPYIGAGAGGALTMFDTDGYTRTVGNKTVWLYDTASDFVFAWQAFAGVRLELNQTMSVGIGYRYLAVDPSSYSFESDYYGGSTVKVGFSALQSHLAAITFNMKF